VVTRAWEEATGAVSPAEVPVAPVEKKGSRS
jgi:hypothetical protein